MACNNKKQQHIENQDARTAARRTTRTSDAQAQLPRKQTTSRAAGRTSSAIHDDSASRPNNGPHLTQPTMDDLDDLHALFADPRTWWNCPNHRHTSVAQTQAMLEQWVTDWQQHHIGYWILRDDRGRFLGTGGVRRCGDAMDMRYAVPPHLWHRKYGSYLASNGIEAAKLYNPTIPVFVTSLARNITSCLIAEHLGFVVVRRDFDLTADAASRRIYANRAVYQQDIDDYMRLSRRSGRTA